METTNIAWGKFVVRKQSGWHGPVWTGEGDTLEAAMADLAAKMIDGIEVFRVVDEATVPTDVVEQLPGIPEGHTLFLASWICHSSGSELRPDAYVVPNGLEVRQRCRSTKDCPAGWAVAFIADGTVRSASAANDGSGGGSYELPEGSMVYDAESKEWKPCRYALRLPDFFADDDGDED